MGNIIALLKNWKNKAYWKELEYNSYGIQGVCIVFQTCLGSIAAAYSLSIGFLLGLGLVTITNIVANAFIISQSPLKWIVRSSIITALTSLIVTIYSVVI